MKGSGRGKGLKVVIIAVILVLMVVGYYYYLSNRNKVPSVEEQAVISRIQEVLLRDLEKNYPPTPKEVVKYFSEISQCFYGQGYTDDELDQLSMKIRELYDDELLANNPEEEYRKELFEDIDEFEEKETVIASFDVSASTDVDYYTEDGAEWAKLYANYTLRQGTELTSTMEEFLLRKDGEGHWKIYGWRVAQPAVQPTEPAE